MSGEVRHKFLTNLLYALEQKADLDEKSIYLEHILTHSQSLHLLLISGFDWDKTEEGHEYWRGVYNSLKEAYDNRARKRRTEEQ